MVERIILGDKVVRWFVKAPDEHQGLVGCLVDDGSNESGWEIVQAARTHLLVVVPGSSGPTTRKSLQWLEQSQLVVPAERFDILDLIQRAQPVYFLELDEAKNRLYARGINLKNIGENDDIIFLDQVMEDWWQHGRLPIPHNRRRAYEIVRSADTYHSTIPVFRLWMDETEKLNTTTYDFIGRLQVGVLLRHAGRITESLKVTEIVDQPNFLSNAPIYEAAMLYCHRAACIMDDIKMREPHQTLLLGSGPTKHFERREAG